MNIEKKFADNFCCVKCRGKAANVRYVGLQPANVFKALFAGDPSPKFYVVTCGLCGYSEMYDARVYALQDEPATEKTPLPQKY